MIYLKIDLIYTAFSKILANEFAKNFPLSYTLML